MKPPSLAFTVFVVIALASILTAIGQPPMPPLPKKALRPTPVVKGAQKQAQTAKASLLAVIVQPPHTNLVTLVYDNTYKVTNSAGSVFTFHPAFWIKSTSELKKLPLTNVMNFTNGTTNIRQGFSFTNSHRYWAITFAP